jgi:hypothetical protein
VTDRRRVGPWLRRYDRQEATRAEERKELAIGIGVGVVGLAALIGVGWLFIRAPYPVLGALVSVWIVGFVSLVFIRRRAALRDHMIGEGHAFHEIRKAIREVGREKEKDGENG